MLWDDVGNAFTPETIHPSVSLTQKHCIPCENGTKPLESAKVEQLLTEVPDWHLDGTQIVRDFLFRDFQAALDWIVAAGAIAEAEGHHPDFHLTGYRKLQVRLSTHAIGGLSDNDFILAAKLDQVPQ